MSDNTATKADYNKLVDDRPEKFSPEQVNFMERSDDAHFCCSCIHWFLNPARTASVCEIMRPEPEADVPAQGRCMFWTPDGEWYPLLG